MCRRNQVHGWILLSFGLGLLTGLCLESSLLAVLIALGLAIGGFRLLCK